MKLEYTALHNSFLQLFEEKVSKVISAAGSSPTEFYKELKTAERSNPSGSDARFAQVRCQVANKHTRQGKAFQ